MAPRPRPVPKVLYSNMWIPATLSDRILDICEKQGLSRHQVILLLLTEALDARDKANG